MFAHVPPLTHHCRRQHHLAPPNITCPEGANITEKSSLSAAFFLVGDGGFAFLRKSHGGCDMPPACRQEPPFESTIINTHTKVKDPSFRMSLLPWWGMVDSNHRRRCQQIYSLSPLATREIPHIQFVTPVLSNITNQRSVCDVERRCDGMNEPSRPRGGERYEVRTDDGAGGRIRTPDLLITNQLLYQLSYTSIFNQRT